MQNLRSATLGCCALLALCCARGVDAQAVQAPVTIDTCAPLLQPNAVASDAPSFMGVSLNSLTSKSAGMKISFVNNGPKVAKLVNFAVDSNGNRFFVRDVGTFSSGVEIDHQYRNGSGQGFFLPAFIAPQITCSVASVEFTDGTMWRRGQPPETLPAAIASPGAAGLSVAPAAVTLDSRSESELFLVQSTSHVADIKETDNCAGIASVFAGAVADRTVSYYVRPVGPGTCAAHFIDQNGTTASMPISVR